MKDKDSIKVKVNGHKVVFPEKRQTGRSVKSLAAAQGAGIEADFVLSLERSSDKTKVIGDDDKITLRDGMCFLAVPPDDNSRDIKDSVERSIEHIRRNYVNANLEIAGDGNGGAFIVVDPVPLGDTYEQDGTWIGFHVTSACEFADVYPHFVRPDLKRADGAALGDGTSSGTFPHPEGPRPAIQISRRTNRKFVPTDRNPLLKLQKVLKWLRSH